MAEWVQCPHCRAGFMGRPDNICPECGKSVKELTTAQAQSASDMSDTRYGMSAAGAVFLLNAAMNVGGTILMSNAPGSGGPGSSGGWLSTVIDVVIGASLLTGNPKFRIWAIVRVALGFLCFTGLFAYMGATILAVAQTCLSLALLALLIGTPGLPRIGVSLAAVLLAFGIEAKVLMDMKAGVNPFAAGAYKKQSDPLTSMTVKGQSFPYHITAPSNKWRLRKNEFALAENPLVDRELVLPDFDAHIFVIGERIPRGVRVDMDKFSEVVIDNMRRASSKVEVLEDSALSTAVDGKLLHFRVTKLELQVELYVGVFVATDGAYQVFCGSSPKTFPKLSADFKKTITSFGVDAN
ncbi:hypothetical protein HY251_14035 [bacterium]|nr:hypothetical protein [bacterium]